ncbi:MAG: antibiotic biosynthesis monooxygenase family protein [Phycisphaerales bacterium]
MVTVGMNYEVIPGKDDAFVAMCDKVIEVMADMPGHQKTRLFRDVRDDHSYLIMSEWSDEDAFNAFIASDQFRQVTQWGQSNVLAARPHHEIFRGADEKDAATGSSGCPVAHD